MSDDFALTLGRWVLSESLLLSWLVTAVLVAMVAWWGPSRRGQPSIALEMAYTLMRNAVAEVVPPGDVPKVLPFVGSLWMFVLVCNLLGLVPGLSSPTKDLSVTGALAIIVFVAVHAYGLCSAGWRLYLRHYITPSPILAPFHLISELTRTLALAIRLFGNMMSLEMAALLVLLVAGLLVPVPLLALHVIEALVQAYIFGMLALIYVSSSLEIRAEHESAIASSPPSSSESSHQE